MTKEILDKIVAAWSKLTDEQKVSDVDTLKDTAWYIAMCMSGEFGFEMPDILKED